MRIIADRNRLELNTWNKGYGNNILHILYVLRIAEEFNINPVIPCDSVLDDIFYTNLIKQTVEGNIPYKYIEKSAYINFRILDLLSLKLKIDLQYKSQSLKSVVKRSKRQFESELAFLKKKRNEKKPFSVRGHFWHYDLSPSISFWNEYLPIKKSLIEIINKNYPELNADNVVAVHYRETDFKHHLTHIYADMVIDDEYYKKAISIIESKLGPNVVYHLFSDNILRLENLFKNKKIVVHNDSAPEDWVALYLCKNIIQSNSSFCWTAALNKTGINIQPKHGQNYHSEIGSIPYGFKMRNAITIPKN